MANPKILGETRLYDGERYLGTVFRYADGYTHSLLRFGVAPLPSLAMALIDFAKTYDELPAAVRHGEPRQALFLTLGAERVPMARRQFHWTAPATRYRIRHLIADDHKQIVAEITLEHQPFGRQKHRYRVRVWWDRGEDGTGHFCARELPRGSVQGDGYPHSGATVGNVGKAKRWADEWLARWLWEWDGCEVVGQGEHT